MIAIIDYGMGNIASLENMISKVGGETIITSDTRSIEKAGKLVLPGIGAFDNGMKRLNELGLIEPLHKKVLHEKIPILGVCLGMQLLTESSEEGILPGLGFVSAKTVRFKFGNNTNLKVPHIGWNEVHIKNESPLFKDMYSEPHFYFVHSYYVKCDNEKDVSTTTFYGFDFVSAIQKDNIMATQFHPEKSHKYGLKLIKNFVEFA